MSEEEGKKEAEQVPPAEAHARIDNGVLRVEIPLFMPNGEYVAYGMLHKAQRIVGVFFEHIEKEANRGREANRILTPVGVTRQH